MIATTGLVCRCRTFLKEEELIALIYVVSGHGTLRAESPSIFLDKSGRGRRLCERLQDSLIRRSSEKMDESVQFPVGETGFLLTRMIIRLFLSGFSTAIRMHKCRDHTNCTRANKLSLRATDCTILNLLNLKLFTLQKLFGL